VLTVLTGMGVNYSPLKGEACPWRYAAEGASETYGGLTAARQPEEPSDFMIEEDRHA